MLKPLLETLNKSLPPIIARTEVGKLTGNLISPRTLANLDCLGKGPMGRFKFKTKVAYEKQAFLVWFAAYLTEADNA